jgi:methylmalonyl-CoA mutase
MTTAVRAEPARTAQPEVYHPAHKVRIVTAASLFDGHDAAINIMRRILQASGAEVIHLGHDRSVQQIVDAAIQEDAQGIAVSSYQGGHMEFFRYMVDLLAAAGCGHIKVFAGGGGTIIPEEKRELEAYGVTRIYHPEDGRRMGLQGMINDILRECDFTTLDLPSANGTAGELTPDNWRGLARAITLVEAVAAGEAEPGPARAPQPTDGRWSDQHVPVVGITGTGGAGKSSFTDEMVRRYTEDFPEAWVAVLSVDPTKRRTGGALLGDRIRMNALSCGRVYMRSLATRSSGREVSAALADAIRIAQAAGFDLVIVETSGIGQADAAIVDLADVSIYVMTPEFGAQTQLEKIEMIDLADLVVINKFDKAGADDALRDVRKAYQRAHNRFAESTEAMPVYATISSQFNDRGCNTVYGTLLDRLRELTGRPLEGRFGDARPTGLPDRDDIIPPRRVGYLAEVADTVRGYKRWAREQAELAGELWALWRTIALLEQRIGGADTRIERIGQIGLGEEVGEDGRLGGYGEEVMGEAAEVLRVLMVEFNGVLERLDPRCRELLAEWPAVRARYRAEQNSYAVRGRKIVVDNFVESLSGQRVAKVALPGFEDWGNVLAWRLLENVPGQFPYTAGVFPYKRTAEDPTRMFAGEGGPWQTNRRFHYLSRHAEAKRLSTAFDSVTLYGEDPDRRPDIWGKVGNSGVSIAHVEDMEALYAGFDLTSPSTSVSMTINGPAPTILAFFFNAAARQGLRRFLREQGRAQISQEECLQPDGGGLSFEALRALVSDAEYAAIVNDTVARIRGTVQADILKEDQAQNTCIFSTEFALRMMGDVQAWFIEHDVRNFYSVSISGYHIAEAGANPISQLAFTLANGFTYVEYYLARGMDVDAFAPSLSFFFSNGMDPEYAVIGRVARRIWATAMERLYGAGPRSQQLKYHVQTSGRSLHAQEIAFNDIRTTLQALLAVYDNCNSLHTNAYDEAVTTPTEESVRRALAIQLILNHEFGLAHNENPSQGAFLIDELTELVEEAVLAEFERLSERGGVLGAMERMYQRSRIQEESLHYEQLKHSGALPIIGVNTFLDESESVARTEMALIRAGEAEKEDQLARLQDFQARHADRVPAAMARLKAAAIAGENVFDELMRAVEVLSLGQITHALYEVGGQYRRSM